MAVELGLDPAGLLELDGPMFDALERAAVARWTVQDELAAAALELAHVHYLDFVRSHWPKARLPKPLRVPRPTGEGFEGPPVLSPAAFALEYGPATSTKGEAV